MTRADLMSGHSRYRARVPVPRRYVLWAIAAYRGGGGGRRRFGIDCNFEPSCSAFAEEAIARFGLRRGVAMAWHRVRRCRVRDSVCKCLEPIPVTATDARSARD